MEEKYNDLYFRLRGCSFNTLPEVLITQILLFMNVNDICKFDTSVCSSSFRPVILKCLENIVVNDKMRGIGAARIGTRTKVLDEVCNPSACYIDIPFHFFPLCS